jgi:hypothetical protein
MGQVVGADECPLTQDKAYENKYPSYKRPPADPATDAAFGRCRLAQLEGVVISRAASGVAAFGRRWGCQSEGR